MKFHIGDLVSVQSESSDLNGANGEVIEVLDASQSVDVTVEFYFGDRTEARVFDETELEKVESLQ